MVEEIENDVHLALKFLERKCKDEFSLRTEQDVTVVNVIPHDNMERAVRLVNILSQVSDSEETSKEVIDIIKSLK